MPTIEVSEETVERLDGLRFDDESDNELIQALLTIYEAEELTLCHGGDDI